MAKKKEQDNSDIKCSSMEEVKQYYQDCRDRQYGKKEDKKDGK